MRRSLLALAAAVVAGGCRFNFDDARCEACPGDGAGSDAEVASYSDLTDSTKWTLFDTTPLGTTTTHFQGTTFDGHRAYFAPVSGVSGYTGMMIGYDVSLPFEASSSWSAFDVATVDANARGYFGAAFDGHHVYLVPLTTASGVYHGRIVRYDTTGGFAASASYEVFDSASVQANARGYYGAVFDGRYMYFVPSVLSPGVFTGQISRFDTQAPFTVAGSWTTFDATTLDVDAKGFKGAIFDGRYLYFVPSYAPRPVVTRYDTQSPFGMASSWSTFDTAVLDPTTQFAGGIFDGRYLYLVPTGGNILRLDTTAVFTDVASWSRFDPTVKSPNPTYYGGAFDGRHAYFMPNNSGRVLRYDTDGDFSAAGSWTTFDTTSLDANARQFATALFDGRYLYLVSQNLLIVRFDARTPPALPALPQFFGSFM